MDSKLQRVKLSDGHFIHALGYGTYKPQEVPNSETLEATKLAIDAGFRHIDTAYVYQVEEEVGQAIKSKIAEGRVRREDIFLTSKLWCTFHRPELVQHGLKTSLKKLGLDYVDLYIIHSPVSMKPGEELFPTDEQGKTLFDTGDICATWEAMEKCKDAGLAKSIGVSNFNRRQLEKILNKPGLKYKPVCNQDLRMSAFLFRVNQSSPVLLEDPVLCAIAKKHKRSPALTALRYQVQRGVVPLAQSFKEKEIKENLQVFEFQLTAEDMNVIDGLHRNLRYLPAEFSQDHPEYPYTDEY
ncbi:PREDICTED: prostaglandin-E(2) 9-reductase-like [Chinchilla lanigera]|uniref:prostaglandin-E(2) 9-reductase-like n=1 Tax=Chinchilla lanigera TaxID=34839 RepID=UPI000696E2E9|nr:PREDICTED: prostaglandin-E(2) 9-reductase-like [Chinchilla lanigera]